MSSERAAFRGGRNRGDRGGRGGGGGGRGGAHGGAGAAAGQAERPKKENILDLGKYMDKRITVKFSGGREGESIVMFIPIGRSTDGGVKSCLDI
jgi:U6 snRNA-associated Sm-like protein LSm7